jgi:hypothetical protein
MVTMLKTLDAFSLFHLYFIDTKLERDNAGDNTSLTHNSLTKYCEPTMRGKYSVLMFASLWVLYWCHESVSSTSTDTYHRSNILWLLFQPNPAQSCMTDHIFGVTCCMSDLCSISLHWILFNCVPHILHSALPYIYILFHCVPHILHTVWILPCLASQPSPPMVALTFWT